MKDLLKFLIINFFIFSISFADAVKFRQTLSKAEGGDPFSQNNIAHMYQNGIGTQKDIHSAFNWYMKAGEQGQVNAMTSIASYYLDGEIYDVNDDIKSEDKLDDNIIGAIKKEINKIENKEMEAMPLNGFQTYSEY